jgi:tetratricopeptide (TPR) repeat protein
MKNIYRVAEDQYWHSGRSPSYGEGIAFWALGEMIRRRAQLTEDADEATTRQRIAETVNEYVADPEERERIGPALLALLGVEEGPAGGRDALFPAWRTFFERIAERGTTVLVFEDLQWADTGLLDFIDHLLDWSRGLPIMVVTLARPELFDRRSDWGANRRQMTALSLDPLTDADVRELLNGLVPGLPEDALAAIVGRAEGVPLYAVETVRGLLADGRIQRNGEIYEPTGDLSTITVPDSLRSLIASRLDGLDPSDRSLLQDAAVLGQVFSAEALAAVNGTDAADLEPRLRDLVRRELLDVERDPSSPERGQYKFVQALIREVAYGTLARRDRRARHLAVARHYESVGDDELAGALASHYRSAHQASDEGAEADAIAAQARLALGAAAERAAALGGNDQAVAYLEQSLAVTRGAADRAPVLDRAARYAAAAASEKAVAFAAEAIAAYEEVGDRAAAVGATARLGKTLLDASELTKAKELLVPAVAEAEAVGDEAALAETLVHLARVHMRLGEVERAIAAADRALPIAEARNLEGLVVEAFVSKGSALNISGRRREAIALQVAALELVQAIGDHNTEMRVRNNLASAYGEDDPARASQMLREARDLARETGDRGMYNWIAGMVAIYARSEGARWDEELGVMYEALDAVTLRTDKIRLLTLIGVLELDRGDRIDERIAELESLVGDSDIVDDRFAVIMTRAHGTLMKGDAEGAYREVLRAVDMQVQNPEIPLSLALRSAVALRDLDKVRFVEARTAELPNSGLLTRSQKLEASAAVAALEGRHADAVAAFREAREILEGMKLHYDAALVAVNAVHLMAEERELAAWAADVRPLLVDVRAAPAIAQLDAALAGAGGAPAPVATAEVPTPN